MGFMKKLTSTRRQTALHSANQADRGGRMALRESGQPKLSDGLSRKQRAKLQAGTPAEGLGRRTRGARVSSTVPNAGAADILLVSAVVNASAASSVASIDAAIVSAPSVDCSVSISCL